MNIAFFGSSILSAYWNGAATYYRGILKSLAQRGHQITFYEPDAFGRQQHRDIDPPSWATCVVYEATESAAARELKRARHADLLVKASGVGVLDTFLESAVLDARMEGHLVAFWDVDAPATLQEMEQNPGCHLRSLIPQFDLVFTYGGGDPVIQSYRRLGAESCVPIYNGLDPGTHFPVAPDPRFHADLVFLGNRLPDREERVDRFFLDAARALPSAHFLLGGSGWDDKPLPENVRYAGHIYTADHNALNSTAQAVLNIARESMAHTGFSPATRVFEAAGAAACIVTDAWTGIEEFFEPGTEILVAHDGDEVAEHLLSLTPQRASEIGTAAYKRALAEHTYDHRAAEVERVLEIRLSA